MKTIIYYTKFSENTVFDNQGLNVFCNQLFTFLINQLGEDFVKNELIIDGDVSLLLQNERIYNLKKVQFSTIEKELFDLIKVSISNLNVSEFYFEENKIILKNNEVWFEINLVRTALSVVDFNGIKLNNKIDILKLK